MSDNQRRKSIVVVGSVNLDIVVSVERLPVAGETVSGGTLNRYPGGKGANQALAAKRLGADVSLAACVGDDANADEALVLLIEAGVDLSSCQRDASQTTGVAVIAVSANGENQICVAPGANAALTPKNFVVTDADALICQLEVPVATLAHACASFNGFVSMNLAPAQDVPEELINRADLVVVNETEADFYGDKLNSIRGLLAITYGAQGAALFENGREMARTTSPSAQVVDTTGAGDTFTAALTLALVEGMQALEALDFACAAASVSTTVAGAQPSLPLRADVELLLSKSTGG